MLEVAHLKRQAQRFLPAGHGLSEIIPLAHDPHPIVVFFYFPQLASSPVLGDPAGLFSISASTGERIGETIFRPEDWEVAYPRSRQARKSALSLSDPAGYRELRAQFDHALSVLLPRFFNGAATLDSYADRQLAGMLLGRWEDATQEGFGDQYRAVGCDWFAWLEAMRPAPPERAVLFERVIWVDALLRYFKNKPAIVVLDALAINEAALAQAREELRVACASSMARGDLELSNRHASELARATVAVAVAKPTLDEVQRLRLGSPPDDLPLPDVVRILAAHAVRA